MPRHESPPERLTIPNFEALRQHEAEIVERVGRRPNGGRLLVLDPLRLLSELSVDLSAEAIRAWEEHSGLQLLEGSRNTAAYDAVAVSSPDVSIRFHVKRILGRAS